MQRRSMARPHQDLIDYGQCIKHRISRTHAKATTEQSESYSVQAVQLWLSGYGWMDGWMDTWGDGWIFRIDIILMFAFWELHHAL